jgi:transposase
VFRRFGRWSRKGIWWRIFEALSDDPHFEYLIVDSTIVRAHQHASGAKKVGLADQAIGRCRGGLSTKIHMAMRGLGCPVRFALTAGQKGDAPQAEALLADLPAEVVMADAALRQRSHPRGDRREGRPGRDPQQPLARPRLRALRRIDWVVYAKPPFGGPSRCWPISAATPTGSPSPTAASSP